ncbi:MAG: SAM-dependent methyltransferase [Flavobacteriales bacterium]|nr:SAM-dependent methyltransferase [Flavobacteriales bacterium]
MEHTGKLYLLPNLLGPSDKDFVITAGATNIINNLTHFIVENEKTARRHLRAIGFNKSFDNVVLYSIGKHSDHSLYPSYLKIAQHGVNIGILSEAGMPGIADPGAEIIALAHNANLKVVPLSGASSIIMALISSGMNGQQFSFHGYLPKEKRARMKKLQQLEKSVGLFGSQIFMETPFRNNQLLEDILKNCSHTTRICIACNLSLSDEYIATKTVSEWKKCVPDLHKKPTVFVIG